MICKKCGSEISNDSLFCKVCGQKCEQGIRKTCPRCNAVLKDEETYCPICGYNIEGLETPTETVDVEGLTNPTVMINRDKGITYQQKITKPIKTSKDLTYFIFLVASIILLVIAFVAPLYNPVFNISSGKSVDFLHYEVTRSQNIEHTFLNEATYTFKYVNVIQMLKMWIAEIKNIETTNFTIDLLNHMGLFVYGITLIAVMILIGSIIVLLVVSLLNIVMKRKLNIYKQVAGLILSTSLTLFLGFGCDGVAILVPIFLSFGLLLYCFLAEVFSKEKKFNINYFIVKIIPVVSIFILLILLAFPTLKSTSDFSTRFDLDSTHSYEGNILTQVTLQFLYIVDPRYASATTTIIAFVTASTLFTGAMALLIIINSFKTAVLSISNPNIALPFKRLWIATLLLALFFVINLLFAQYVNNSEYAILAATYVEPTSEQLDEIRQASKCLSVPITTFISIIWLVIVSAITSVSYKICERVK